MTNKTFFFFFNDTATTEIYTLSLHDALPIYTLFGEVVSGMDVVDKIKKGDAAANGMVRSPDKIVKMQLARSEEHTSELQSRQYLVCRLLLEKKNYSSTSTVLCTIFSRHFLYL